MRKVYKKILIFVIIYLLLYLFFTVIKELHYMRVLSSASLYAISTTMIDIVFYGWLGVFIGFSISITTLISFISASINAIRGSSILIKEDGDANLSSNQTSLIKLNENTTSLNTVIWLLINFLTFVFSIIATFISFVAYALGH